MLEQALNETNTETKARITKILEGSLNKKSFEKLYIELYGWHFTEDMAHKAVQGMKNGKSDGENVPKERTDDSARRLGITFDNFNEWDWYFVVNMVFSDYMQSFDSAQLYQIAKMWIEDVDAPKGKAFRYWWKVIKKR